jgi:hypothetical protein
MVSRWGPVVRTSWLRTASTGSIASISAPPTLREIRQGLEGFPSHSTIKRLYGNTSTMFRSHGSQPRRPGAQPGMANHLRVSRGPRGLFVNPERAAARE